jgi:outer membrane protein
MISKKRLHWDRVFSILTDFIKIKPAILIWALSLTVFQSVAQKQLTLHDAIELAVASNKDLTLSKADLEIAKAKVAQAKDQAWPELKASATYIRINTPSVNFSSPQATSGDSPGPLAAFANLNSIGLARLSLSEPIFAGFKIRNSAIMQKYLEEATAYDVTTTRSSVILNTARAIFQYYQLLETRKVLDQNLKQAQQRVTEFTNLEKQGMLARNDRLKAELQVNNITLARTEVNNNVLLADFNLHILLGLSDSAAIQLDTAGMFKSPDVATYEDYEQAGLENRSALKATRLRAEAGRAGVRIAKASRYPVLALSAGYVNAYIPNVVSITNALNGGLGLQYNLTGAFHTRHRLQEARANLHKAELSSQMLQDKIRMEIREKFLNYQKSLEKLVLNQQAIEQAQENFNISKNKFDAGLMIMSDYLDADVLLLQARINYVTAKADSMIAWYELENATGNLDKGN